MVDEIPRSRQARVAAERALVRVVHHYGSLPEFVVLGGLVPELLCSGSAFQHAGTTDVDVQVNLEAVSSTINAPRLEDALRNAEFYPDAERVWRWKADGASTNTVVKFELLTDLDTAPAQSIVEFDGCDQLGAVNLRGTRFAIEDYSPVSLTARVGDTQREVEVNVTGLAGFLLAKVAAAHSRRKPKDWYDIAFVLLHNDKGGPASAATRVRDRFPDSLGGSVQTSLRDLVANFESPQMQGPRAYALQMAEDHPEIPAAEAAADAVAAVGEFYEGLLG